MSRVAELWERIWFPEESLLRLGVFRVLILLITLYSLEQPAGFILRYAGRTGAEIPLVWNPVYFLEALGFGPPSRFMALAVLTVLLVSIVFATLGLFTRWAMAVVAVLALFWWGLGYSFDQAHHDKISLAFAVLALPFSPCGSRFSLDSLLRRRRGQPLPTTSVFAAWPIRLTQISVASSYMFAGLTKIAVAGFEWMNGFTLQSIVYLDHPFTDLIASDVRIAQLASIGVLLLQTTFPLIFLHRSLRWIYVPGVAGFHLGAWVTMSTGPFLTLWLVAFVAFFRVERLPATLVESWRAGRHARVLVQTLAVIAFSILCAAIMGRHDPWWVSVLWLFAFACVAALLPRSLAPGARSQGPSTA